MGNNLIRSNKKIELKLDLYRNYLNMTSFFNFGDNNMRTLFNFLQDALAKNNEFEIRFGKFYQDKSRSNDGRHHTNFDSNMETNSFYNLKRMFEKQNVTQQVKRTKEFIYQSRGQNGSVKRIVDLDDNSETTMMKQSIRKYDVYDYDLRMSVSYERKGVSVPNETDLVLVRTKDRTSFRLPFGSLDLTVVQEHKVHKEHKDYKSVTKYEVEMEITAMDQNMIMTYLMIILQNRQDNFFVIPGNERRRVVGEYRAIVQNNYFVGAQPETLHKEKISKLYKSEYSVTDKADGERAFLVIDKDGLVYFIDNNLNRLFKTDLVSCKSEESSQEEDNLSTSSSCNDQNSKKLYYSTVIDGELVKHDNKIYFLAFDILAYNNRDLRGKQEYNLKRRLDRLTHVIKTLSSSKYYVVNVKHYYFGNVFSGSKKILDSVDQKFYENDGLIFTPINEPYPVVKKWQNLLKWKPAELNTIDFYAKRANGESSSGISVWQLYVQGEIQQEVKHKTQTVLFDVNALCGNDTQSKTITYETTFADDLVDSTTGELYKTNTVIEFRWDFSLNKFVPLRTRWDKTVNPKKHGNFSKVACDIWNNINNPIEKEYLLKFYSNVKSGNEDFFFERMRRYHNKIKEYLYNKYCKDTTSLLELCSGRGGDMHKWIYNNIRNVIGYDISEKSIEECKRRLETTKIKNDYKYEFYKLDLTRDDASDIIYNTLASSGKDTLSTAALGNKDTLSTVDTVCCQFGVHYFFKSERTLDNIINVLDKTLKRGGHFIVTFMDNTRLDNLFGDKKSVSYEIDNEIVYLLERESLGIQSNFGNSLKITLNGNNILGEGSEEWIIDFDDFCKRMESRGYRCIETELFSKLYNPKMAGVELQECERNISFLNRYCVFEKVQPNNIDVHIRNQIVFDNMTTEFDFDTIDLHQKNIIVQRISSLYNIVDLVNCIEYRYYKNDIKNVELDNMPEKIIPIIEKMFNDLRIQYKPIFIKDPLDFSEYSESNNQIYFTYHKHTVEKRSETVTDSNEENVEYNNWYIIMYKDQLLFNKPVEQITNEILEPTRNEILEPTQNEILEPTRNEILEPMQNEILERLLAEDLQNLERVEAERVEEERGLITKLLELSKLIVEEERVEEERVEAERVQLLQESEPTQNEILEPTRNEILEQTRNDIKQQLLQDYNTAKDSNVKFTIKILKDFLQRVDLKLSGKRDELQQRLETYLMV